MSYLGGFPAKTSASQVKAQALTANAQECGDTWRELPVKSPLILSLSKTRPRSEHGGLTSFSLTLPVWGMMHGGALLERTPPAFRIVAPVSGFWPTPRAGRPGSRPNGKGGKVLQEEVQIAEGIRKRGQKVKPKSLPGLSPEWVEWLMGWPIGWTDLKPLGTDKFLRWQQQRLDI